MNILQKPSHGTHESMKAKHPLYIKIKNKVFFKRQSTGELDQP